MSSDISNMFDTMSDIGTGWGQMIGLGPAVGETAAQGDVRRAGEAAAKKRKHLASAPTPDDKTSRRAAQRRRVRTRAGTGRAGTMLSSDTLG